MRFSAPIGTPADGYAEFSAKQQTILPPPNDGYNPTHAQIIPGTPHPGPYGNEYVNGVAAAGFEAGDVFRTGDFSGGDGVFVGMEVVPATGAPNGSSPGFTSGPIIRNAPLDMTFTGDVSRNGAVFDDSNSFAVQDVNEVVAGVATTNYAGFSHFPLSPAEATDFGPAGTGSYAEQITLLDTGGHGYTIGTTFAVVPEPSALAATAAGGGLAVARRLRRQCPRRAATGPGTRG